MKSQFGGSISGSMSSLDDKSSKFGHSKSPPPKQAHRNVGDKNNTTAAAAAAVPPVVRKKSTVYTDPNITDDIISNIVRGKISIKHGFGCNPCTLDPLQAFTSIAGSEKDSSDRLVFKIGSQIACFDPESRRQNYFTGQPKDVSKIVHSSVSGNFKFLSIVESLRFDPTEVVDAQVSVYSLTNYSRLKTLTYPSLVDFSSSEFTRDGKHLLTYLETTERQVLIWLWEKEKLIRTVSVPDSVSRIRVGTLNSSVLFSCSGHGYLKLWFPLSDGSYKPSNLLSTARENECTITDHVWLHSHVVVHKMIALAEIDLNSNNLSGNMSVANSQSTLSTHHGAGNDLGNRKPSSSWVGGHHNPGSHGDGSGAALQPWLYKKQCIYIFEGTESMNSSSNGPPVGLELRQTLVLKPSPSPSLGSGAPSSIPFGSSNMNGDMNASGNMLVNNNGSLTYGSAMSNASSVLVPPPWVAAMAGYSKGFVLVGRNGYVAIYDRTEEKRDPYLESKRLNLGELDLIAAQVFPSEEKFAVLTSTRRLFAVVIDSSVHVANAVQAAAVNAVTNSGANGKMDPLLAGSGGSGNSSTLMAEELAAVLATYASESSSRRANKGQGGAQNGDVSGDNSGPGGSNGAGGSGSNSASLLLSMSGATELLPGGTHSEPIIAADIAYDRSMLVTISFDHTARFWNFITGACELVYSFRSEEPLSVALHGSGFKVLVSFKDRVRMYQILLDRLQPHRETIQKSCREIRFSHGGQYWAGASTINVVVYDTKTFVPLQTFQGHMMTVRRLLWAPGDQILFSAGADGNVYGWMINTDVRLDVISANNRSTNILALEVDSNSTAFPKVELESSSSSSSSGNGASDGPPTSSDDDSNNNGAKGGACRSLIVTYMDGSCKFPQWTYDHRQPSRSTAICPGPPSAQNSGSSSSKNNAPVNPCCDPVFFMPGDGRAVITAVSLSPCRRYLFAGTATGTLRVYPWPPIACYDSNYYMNNVANGSNSSSGNTSVNNAVASGAAGAANNSQTNNGAVPNVNSNHPSVAALIALASTLPPSSGAILRSLKFGELYLELSAHSSSVVAIRLSPMGDMLLSVAEDTSIFVTSFAKITTSPSLLMMRGKSSAFPSGAAAATPSNSSATSAAGESTENEEFADLSNEFRYNSDVLMISSDDMEDHVHELMSLQKALQMTKAKAEFVFHQKELEHEEEVKTMGERNDHLLSDERTKYETLKLEFDRRVRELLSTMEVKEIEHVKITTELENRYEHKLTDQLERFDNLSEEMELLKQKCEGLLKAEREEFQGQIGELKNEARTREKKLRTENRRIMEDRTADESAFKEILNQQEEEYEDELRQLIGAAESELNNERDTVVKLRTLIQTKNTKLDQLKKKLVEINSIAKARLNLINVEKQEKVQLSQTIEHYKKNLLEREQALSEKEKIILELRSTTRTLENFRFVLDHRLQQLSAERGPITAHIEGLERHIATMYEELVEEFDMKKTTQENLALKTQKIGLLSKDISKIRYEAREKERYITSFKRDLEVIVTSMTTGKDLEEAVNKMYKRYIRNENVDVVVKANDLVQNVLDEVLHNKEPSSGTTTTLSRDWSNDDDDGDGNGKFHSKSIIAEVDSALVDTAKEADRQRVFKEREVKNLRHRLSVSKLESQRLTRRTIYDNSTLLYECNEMRKIIRDQDRQLQNYRDQLHHANKTIQLMHSQDVNPAFANRLLGTNSVVVNNGSNNAGNNASVSDQALNDSRISSPAEDLRQRSNSQVVEREGRGPTGATGGNDSFLVIRTDSLASDTSKPPFEEDDMHGNDFKQEDDEDDELNSRHLVKKYIQETQRGRSFKGVSASTLGRTGSSGAGNGNIEGTGPSSSDGRNRPQSFSSNPSLSTFGLPLDPRVSGVIVDGHHQSNGNNNGATNNQEGMRKSQSTSAVANPTNNLVGNPTNGDNPASTVAMGAGVLKRAAKLPGRSAAVSASTSQLPSLPTNANAGAGNLAETAPAHRFPHEKQKERDRQVDRYRREIETLSELLDESQREKDMQRLEISRMRKQLAQFMSVGLTGMIGGTGPVIPSRFNSGEAYYPPALAPAPPPGNVNSFTSIPRTFMDDGDFDNSSIPSEFRVPLNNGAMSAGMNMGGSLNPTAASMSSPMVIPSTVSPMTFQAANKYGAIEDSIGDMSSYGHNANNANNGQRSNQPSQRPPIRTNNEFLANSHSSAYVVDPSLTNADLYGVPSNEDMKHLQLSPVSKNPSSANPTRKTISKGKK